MQSFHNYTNVYFEHKDHPDVFTNSPSVRALFRIHMTYDNHPIHPIHPNHSVHPVHPVHPIHPIYPIHPIHYWNCQQRCYTTPGWHKVREPTNRVHR